MSKAAKELEAEIAQKKVEREKLDAVISALEKIARRMRGESAPRKARAPRSNVKNFVLQSLQEAKSDGGNAASICEDAEAQGTPLERGSVSSLLSRLKNDGVVVYDGALYRLTQYAEEDHASDNSSNQQEFVH